MVKEAELTELQKQLKVKELDLQEEKYKVESLDNRIRNSKKNVSLLFHPSTNKHCINLTCSKTNCTLNSSKKSRKLLSKKRYTLVNATVIDNILIIEQVYEEALESMRKDYAALEAKNATLQSKLTSLSQGIKHLNQILIVLFYYLFPKDRNQKTASLASFGAALSQVAIGGSVQVANYEVCFSHIYVFIC